MRTDLPALWQSLGVEPQDGTVKLNDDAPLAKIRDAIMRAPVNSPRLRHEDSDRSASQIFNSHPYVEDSHASENWFHS